MTSGKKSRNKLSPYLLGVFIVGGGAYGYYQWLNSSPSKTNWKAKNTDIPEETYKPQNTDTKPTLPTE